MQTQTDINYNSKKINSLTAELELQANYFKLRSMKPSKIAKCMAAFDITPDLLILTKTYIFKANLSFLFTSINQVILEIVFSQVSSAESPFITYKASYIKLARLLCCPFASRCQSNSN